MNKKAKMKGGVLLSFCLVFLCSTVMAIFGIAGFGINTNSARAEGEEAIETTTLNDGASDTKPANEGNGTQANPFILWGDTENKANIWAKAVSVAQVSSDRVYVKLASDWVASENDDFTTSFAGNLGYNLAAAANYAVNARCVNSPFFHGAICVPESVKMAIDLNGKTINRNLDDANGVAVYCHAIYMSYYSDFEINDSTAVGVGTNQTYVGDGKITGAIGGLNASGAREVGGAIRGIYAVLTINGGQICNNRGTSSGAGIYTENCTVTMNGGSINNNVSTASGGGITIRGFGNLTLNGGEICNNIATTNGGGAFIFGDTAEFIMNGGKIHDNNAVNGGAVQINASKGAIINGGEIYGNTATSGGAIQMWSNASWSSEGCRSNTVINGGKIYKNTAFGGGAFFLSWYADMIINGGEIYENLAKNTGTSNSWGSIVRVGQFSTLEINGGKFYDNSFEGIVYSGIRCDINTSLKITGGEYYGNKVKDQLVHTQEYFRLTGGQFYGNFIMGGTNEQTTAICAVGSTPNTKFFLSGEPYVGYKKNADGTVVEALNYRGFEGTQTKQPGPGGLYTAATSTANLYTSTNAVANIDGPFTGKARVHIWPGGVFTNGWGKYNSVKQEDVDKYFVSDFSTCSIEVEDGELIYVRSNVAGNRVALPIFENGDRKDQFYVSEDGNYTASFKIDGNSSFTLARAAGGDPVALTAGTDYTVSKDEASGLTNISVKKFGRYILTVTPNTGYYWGDTADTNNTAKTLNFYVRQEMELPYKTNLSSSDIWIRYDGNQHAIGYFADTGVKVSRYRRNTISAVDAWNDGSAVIDEANKQVLITDRGRYDIYFVLLNTDEYVWTDGTDTEKSFYFYCLTYIEAPLWAGKINTLIATPEEAAAGLSMTAYSDPELRPLSVSATLNGVAVDMNDGTLTVDLTNGVVTATKPGNYVIALGRGKQGYSEYLFNSTNATTTQSLYLHVKNTVSCPKWSDLTTADKRFDVDGDSHTVSFSVPAGATVSCENENAVLGNGTLTASKPGTYEIIFTLDDPEGTMWSDGYLGATKTLTVHIAKVVQQIVWADGATATTRYIGYNGNNILLFKVPEGVKVTCCNPAGVNYNAQTGEIYAIGKGVLEFLFSPEEGYIWTGNKLAELKYSAYVVDYVAIPTWSDGTNAAKYLPYNNGTQTITADITGTRIVVLEILDYEGFSVRFNVNSLPFEVEWKGITVKIEVTGNTAKLTLSKPAQYIFSALPTDSFAIWEGTSTIASPYNLTAYITGTKVVTLPTWSDGSTNLFAEYKGVPGTFYFITEGLSDLPEGLVVSRVNYGGNTGSLNGNSVTFDKYATGTVYFKLADPTIYKWADGSDPKSEKSIGLYFRKSIAIPVWGDGSTDAITVRKGGNNSFTIIAAKELLCTASNSGATVTTRALNGDLNEITITASEVGAYSFTFALPNGGYYFWEGNPTMATNANIKYTLKFTIIGAEEVEMPVWDTGVGGTKNFAYSGSYTDITVAVPANATLIDDISNDAGLNGKLLSVSGGVATVRFSAAGVYRLKFVIDTENYVWANGSLSNVVELVATVTERLPIPTWDDDSTAAKYVTYTAGGVTVPFVMPSNVLVSVNNRNGAISGNTLVASEPGQYVLTFNFDENKMCHAWDDGVFTAGASKTLTLYVTGGTKVDLPAWADGTTEIKYMSVNSTDKSISTYKIPTGVDVTVSSNTTPATVSIRNGVATISATAVGTYTVRFKIDTSKYVWADNSVADTKTLTFYVTAKTLVDFPTWAEGGTDVKYIPFPMGSGTPITLGLKYAAADVNVEVTDGLGRVVNNAVSGQNFIADILGVYTITFSLKNLTEKSWQNNTTAPRTLKVYYSMLEEIPEWTDGGTDAKYLQYDKDGHTLEFGVSIDVKITLSYKDENGISRAMTLGSDRETWTATFNGKTVTAVINVDYASATSSSMTTGSIFATAPGTYTMTFALNNIPSGDMWKGTTSTADRTLTFTINPENVTEVSFPEWAEGGSDDKYLAYDGVNAVTIAVKDGENYVISAVSAPATFNGNEVIVKGVGKFTVTLKLANVKNYVWAGGEGGTKTLTFYVTGKDAAEAAVPEWADGGVADKAFTYDGTNKSVTIAALSAGVEVLSVSNGVSQSGNTFTAKGSSTGTVSYTITFKLANTVDYKWSDGTVGNKTLKFYIIGGKTVIDIPEDEKVTYNGRTQAFEAPEDGAVSIVSVSNGGTFGGKTVMVENAGTYVVTLRLTSTASTSYVWSNNTSADYKWTIVVDKADLDTKNFKLNTFTGAYDGADHFASVSGMPVWVTANYAYTDATGATVTEVKNAGTYNVTVTFTHGNNNYTAIPLTLTGTVTINKAVLSVQWTNAKAEYDYNGGNSVALGASVSGVVPGEAAPYTVLLDGTNASAGSAIGDYTAKVSLKANANNYTFAGGATQVTYAYSVKNLSTVVTDIAVTFSQTGITLSTTDEISAVASGISRVTVTYDNGYGEQLTADKYTLSGDFGAANPYFKVCYMGAQSREISVTVTHIVDLSAIRVEEVGSITVSMTVAELKALLKITAAYTDGAEKSLDGAAVKLLENGSPLADTATLTEGKHTLTVSYKQGEITCADTVNVTVESVKLSSLAAELSDGAKIYASTTDAEIKAALTVTATYSDGSVAAVSDYTISHAAFAAGSAYTITVAYNGKTVAITGTVEADAITAVTAEWLYGSQAQSGMPPVYVYTNIEEIRDYIVVKANGNPVTGYLVSGTLTADGISTVTVTYANVSATIDVAVAATPASVTFKEVRALFNQGNTVIYTSTSLSSLKYLLTVEEVYTDGANEIVKVIADYTLSGTLVAGNCSLGVSYTDGDGNARTASFTANVTAVELGTINVAWKGGSQPVIYNTLALGELKSLISVSGVYNNGEAYPAITENDFTLSGSLSAGTAEITVTVDGKSATFTVEVTAVALTGISVSWKNGSQGNFKVYTSTSPEELKNLIVVKAIYNDNAAGVVLGASEYSVSANFVLGDANSPLTVSYNGFTDSALTVKVEGSELIGITARYTQSGAVYSSTAIETLKSSGLVVTAKFSGGVADAIVPTGDYTLTGDLTKGECTVTVTYNGKTTTFAVMVTEVALVSVSATFDAASAGTVYTTADVQALKNFITVTATYGDSSYKTVTTESFSLAGSLKSGKNILTITYGGKTATVEVTAESVSLESVSAAYANSNPVYSTANLSELKKYLTVTAVYSDKTVATVTDYELSGKLTAGKTCNITVEYNGKTATFAVQVEAKTLASVSASWTSAQPTVYPYTDIEDLRSALTVTATFNDGSSATVSDYELSGDLKTPNAQITVTYGGRTDTMTVNVTAPATPVTMQLTAAFDCGNAKIYAGASLESLKGYLTVTASYGTESKIVQSGSYTLSGSLVAGECTVTVSYEGKTAQFTVNVTAVELTAITAEYVQNGEVKNSTELGALQTLTVTAYYNDGTVRTLGAGEYTLSGDLVAGSACVITVAYGDMTDTFTVNVAATPVTFTLSATFDAAAGNVYVSTPVENLRANLTVTASYSDGTVKAVTGYTFVTASLTSGNCTVTVSYQGQTAQFTVGVLAVKLESIDASFNQGNNKIYTSSDLSALAAYLTVTGVNNDGTPAGNIALAAGGYKLEGELKAGKSSVTVTLLSGSGAGKSATFEVEVSGVRAESLTATFNAGTDKIYSTAPLEDLKKYLAVTVTYNDGNTKVLTAEAYTLSGALAADTLCLLTVAYNGVSATVSVQVEAKELQRIEVSYAQSGTLYSYNTIADVLANGALTVTAYYTDGTDEQVASGYTLSGTLTSGNCLIAVAYGGKTDTFEAAVSAVTLVSITAAPGSGAPEFYTTTALATVKNYLAVTANYSDGSHKTLATGEFELTGTLAAGASALTVSYDGKTCGVTVNVTAVVLEGIAAETENLPAIFANADIEDLRAYLAVFATYTDGRIAVVTEYNLAGTLVAGETCTVTVTYGGETTTFDVKVEAKELVRIVAVYNGGSVPADTALTDLNVSVTAYYSDNTSAIITSGYTLYGSLTAGSSNTITVTYGDKSATITVQADGSVTLAGITATLGGNAAIYTSTSLSSLKQVLTVEEVYSNGSTKPVPANGYTLSGSLSVEGERTVVVTLVSDSRIRTDLKVNVLKVEIESIAATFDAASAGEIFISAALNDLRAYLTVSGVNNDGSEETRITGYTLYGDIKEGECLITVEYLGKFATFTVTVSNNDESGNPITLREITAVAAIPAGVEIYPDANAEDLRAYLAVNAVYATSSGDVTQAVTGYTFVTPKVTLSGGKYIVTVEFGGKRADAEITVTPVTLAQINADFKQNGDTIYTSASYADLERYLTVTGLNNDGTLYNGGAPITSGYVLSGELTAGKCKITVMYRGITATFTVEVTAVTIDSLTVNPDANIPVVYTTTSLEDLKQYIAVYANYNDGSAPKAVAPADYTLSGELLAGKTCTVTVTYNGVSETFGVEVAATVLTGITVSYDEHGTAPEVYSSTELDSLKAYLEVTALFNVGAPKTLSADEYALSGDLTKGVCTVTVSYNGKTETFIVNVTEVALVTLNAQFDAASAPEVFSTTSLEALRGYITVTAGYSDGNSKEIAEYAFAANTSLKEGANTVTVIYGGKNATFTVNVTGVKLGGVVAVFDRTNAPKVFRDTNPDDLRQWLTVTASYTDNKLATVYDYTLSGAFEAGKTCTVTVSYGGKTATFDVTVEKKSLSSIVAAYSGNTTVDGNVTLDDLAAFVTVTAVYDDGSYDENVTGFTLSGTIASGPVTITVNYGGKTDSFNVTVTATYILNKITASFEQGNTRVYAGKTSVDSLKNMLTVTAHYVDASGYSIGSKVLESGEYSLTGSLTAGQATLTAVYRGLRAQFTVNVTAIELDSITAVFNPGSNKITASTELNAGAGSIRSYLTVTGLNNDGSAYNNGNAIAANDLTVTGDLVAGAVCTLTVRCGNVSTTFDVSVSADVTFTNITVTFDQTALGGTVYTSSDAEMLADGIVVTAHYSNGTQRIIEYPNYSFTCDLINNGDSDATIYVTYGTATHVAATGRVAVKAVKVAQISASFNQNGEPLYNSMSLADFEALLTNGNVSLSVVGINNDGSFVGTVSGYTLSCDFSTSGQVEVDYNGVKTTFNVILISNKLSGIFVTYGGNAVIYESQSIDKLKDYLTVEANYTGEGSVRLAAGDYTLSSVEISRDADKISYTVTVHYFDKFYEITVPVNVQFVKLTGVTATLDPAYKSANIVIYDSMSAADAAALLESYLTITGYYNDSSDSALSLAAFIATGDLSVLNASNEATVTLTFATHTDISCTFEAEVTRVAFSHLEIEFKQPNAAKVYASQTLADLESMIEEIILELDVTAYFNNGSHRVLDFTDYAISADASEFNADGQTLKIGLRTIKVTYTHGTASDTKTFEVKVDAVGVKTLSATLNGNTVYTTTTLAEFYRMITVTAVYNNDVVYNPDSTEYSTTLTGTNPFLAEAGNSITVTVTFGAKTCNVIFTVQKAVVTIDVSGIGDYTYGDNVVGGLQTVEGGAKLMLGTTEITGATLAYTQNTFATYSDLTGGQITIKIDFAGDSVYAAASTTCTVTVLKAQASLTGYTFLYDGAAYNGANKTYDDNAHTLALGTAYPTGVTGIASYSYKFTRHGDTTVQTVTAGDIKNAGTYTVTATLVYDENYTGPATMTQTLVIDKAQAQIDTSAVQNTFTYTGTAHTVGGATLTVGDQTITYTVGTTVNTTGFTFTHVNEGNGVTVTIAVAPSDNYLGQSIPVNVIVNKAALTVTANPKTIEYGDQPANDGVTVAGLQNGETLAALGATVNYSYNYVGTGGLIGDVGNYVISITLQGGSLGDYSVTTVGGTLTVTEKEVNVDWTGTDVTYDGAAHKPMASFTDIYGNPVGLTVLLADTPDGTLVSGEAINAGKYKATITNSNKNYTYSAATKEFEFEIKLAQISVIKSGDSWFADGLVYDKDALITLNTPDAGGMYEYIHIIGDQTATIEIKYGTQAWLKGTEPQPSADSYGLSKPMNITSPGSYIVNYMITVANHEVYRGAWTVDILDDTDPAAKFIQIIFTKPYSFEYGSVPETQAELEALAEELYDEGYIDTAKLKLNKQAFLANLNLVLKADNETAVDKDTGFGNYTMYFEWKSDSSYAADWSIAYKEGNLASDSNVSKLHITKKKLSASWSDTSFIADGTVHLPTLTISGFNDGSVYELALTSAESGVYTIEKDGRTLILSVNITGNLSSAGAHVITVSLDNENFDVQGAVTAISVTAPTVLTVAWDSTNFTANGTVHLPTATVSDGTNSATIAITEQMVNNGGGTVEIALGDATVTVTVTITGSGRLLCDAGRYTVTLSVSDNRYTLPTGTVTVSVDAPAVAQEEGLSPLMIGIIAAVAVLAVLLIIVIIVVIKRKPATVTRGSDDGFDDYVED